MDAAPPTLIEAVAGLALLGALGNSLTGAMVDPDDREAAIVTLVVTVSGVAFFGISGAFWGLAAGGTLHAVRRRRVRREASAVSGRRVSGRVGRGRWSGSRVRRRSR